MTATRFVLGLDIQKRLAVGSGEALRAFLVLLDHGGVVADPLRAALEHPVQGRLLLRDIRHIAGDCIGEFSQTANIALKLSVVARKGREPAGQLLVHLV